MLSQAMLGKFELFQIFQTFGEIPLDESNLVVKAAKALATFAGIGNPQPMRFEIQKQVPVAGGMAGGSADAAAALVALNEAWSLGLESGSS